MSGHRTFGAVGQHPVSGGIMHVSWRQTWGGIMHVVSYVWAVSYIRHHVLQYQTCLAVLCMSSGCFSQLCTVSRLWAVHHLLGHHRCVAQYLWDAAPCVPCVGHHFCHTHGGMCHMPAVHSSGVQAHTVTHMVGQVCTPWLIGGTRVLHVLSVPLGGLLCGMLLLCGVLHMVGGHFLAEVA